MINNPEKRKVLIYCRVSTARQSNDGHGLDSQEQRCKNYCYKEGLIVEKVFSDSYTGGGDFLGRPAMRSLLEYIDDKPHEKFFVLFDDLKRFARDTEFHLKLRTNLSARNIIPLCLNYKFDDTPEGRFVETIFAAQGQLEREQNKRQVIQKQKARLERGYWAFNGLIPGFNMIKDPVHGKLLKPNRLAPVVKEAFEGFESGRFQTQSDVQDFLQSKNFAGRNRKIHLEKVKRLLTRSIYAGIIEFPKWDVARRPGHHEAIVSVQTFDNVQRILEEGRRVRVRKDISNDFPLRGLICSKGSNKPYTASYSKGRKNKYGYYRDTDKESLYYNKSFKKEVVEKSMEKKFSDTLADELVIEFTESLIQDEWSKRKDKKGAEEHEIELELAHIRRETEKLAERATKAKSDRVAEVYESKMEKLISGETALLKKLRKTKNSIDFGTAFNKVMEYIKTPLKQWESNNLTKQRTIVQLVFDGLAEYHPIYGFGTAKLAPIYGIFEQVSASNFQDVEKPGIEPGSKQG